LLLLACIAACSTKAGEGGGVGSAGGVAVIPAIPSGAQNPLVIGVEDATVEQLATAAEVVISGEGLSMIQAATKDGVVETRMFDLGTIRGYAPDVAGIDPQERQVYYAFLSGKNPQGIMVTEIIGYYKPNPEMARTNAQYKEKLPTSHPGFAYQVRLQLLLKNELEKHEIAIIESGG